MKSEFVKIEKHNQNNKNTHLEISKKVVQPRDKIIMEKTNNKTMIKSSDEENTLIINIFEGHFNLV